MSFSSLVGEAVYYDAAPAITTTVTDATLGGLSATDFTISAKSILISSTGTPGFTGLWTKGGRDVISVTYSSGANTLRVRAGGLNIIESGIFDGSVPQHSVLTFAVATNTLELFVDGVSRGTAVLSSASNTSDLIVGGDGTGRNLTETLSEFGVWRRVLTLSEIETLDAGLATTGNPLANLLNSNRSMRHAL